MADPLLHLAKLQQTGQHQWIGAIDGLIRGFELNRGSSSEQIEIATMQIIEFFIKHHQIGLQCLANQMQSIGTVPDSATPPENDEQWGDINGKLRRLIQALCKKLRAHSGPLAKFSWPNPPEGSEAIVQDLLEFANTILQHSAVFDWWKQQPNNATKLDYKYVKGIIDVFWLGHVEYNAWLAEEAAWNC